MSAIAAAPWVRSSNGGVHVSHFPDNAQLSGAGTRNAELSRSVSVTVPTPGGRTVVLTVVRSSFQDAFPAADLDMLEALSPHIARAVALHEELSAAREVRALLDALADDCGVGAAITGSDGVAIFMTEALRVLAARRDGIEVDSRGILRACHRSSAQALSNAITAATSRAGGARQMVTIRRSQDDPPLLALVAPFAVVPDLGATRCALLVTGTRNPGKRSEPAVLKLAFGLTRAEAGLVSRIVEGDSLSEAAEELEISINTGRTHLRRAFAKTGTSRQGQLVALVRARLAPVFA